MGALNTVYMNIFALIVLLLLFINIYDRTERVFYDYKVFCNLIIMNIILIIIDLLSWVFDQKPGEINFLLNNLFNLLLYVIEPIAAVLWIYYCNFQVFQDESRVKKLKRPITVLIVINGIISVISLYTGWFFIVDANNIYHRGTYYWFHIVFSYSLLSYALYTVFSKRFIIDRRHYISLLLFPVPQVIGGVLQAFILGLSISWSGMVLSILIIYFNIQNRDLNTDYLTGAYNRRHLEYYVKQKIKGSSKEKSFSLILIDIDKFKQINDSYGHVVGDEALKMTVMLLNKCLSGKGFIARYGGDEFCIILDIDDMHLLREAIRSIYACTDEFNKYSDKKYRIDFSIGYDIYNCKSGQNYEDFIKHVDMLMYEDKKSSFLA